MFGDDDLEGYSGVLLWRDYDPTLGINHNVGHYITRNGGNTGYTRGFVDNFLMQNGLPIYASGSGYQGDDSVQDRKSVVEGKSVSGRVDNGDVRDIKKKKK